MNTRTLNLIDDHRRGRSSGDCAEHNGWISAKKMLPRLTAAERKPGSFGRQVLIYPPIQEPGCADQHTAFYGCRLTDEPAFYLHGRVIDVEWWQPLPEPPRERPVLNLTDNHRRLHLRQSEIEPTLVCVLLFVEDRPMAYAHADVQRCRFSMSSDGPLFWVGDTSFVITAQERREIERFLCELAEALKNARERASDRFDEFWALYPRRVGKAAAKRAWSRKGLNDKADEILEHLRARVRSDAQWLAEGGKFIPRPQTWLNRDGWLDEYQVGQAG